MRVFIIRIYLLYLTKDLGRVSEKKDITMVKQIAVSHGMASAIETKPLPPNVRDGLVEGSVEGLY